MNWDRPVRDERDDWNQSVERDWIARERNDAADERWEREPRDDGDTTADAGSET